MRSWSIRLAGVRIQQLSKHVPELGDYQHIYWWRIQYVYSSMPSIAVHDSFAVVWGHPVSRLVVKAIILKSSSFWPWRLYSRSFDWSSTCVTQMADDGCVRGAIQHYVENDCLYISLPNGRIAVLSIICVIRARFAASSLPESYARKRQKLHSWRMSIRFTMGLYTGRMAER